ncbi:hypothetical protein [Streptomyces yokosukanensis]|uniref:hypothetical protein n=1 Tax=Streptomyces yokosukanensis TaxID=67386 RepID=UPI000A826853|nr:hypothetical protein [Streptomyces yokosukanensis]
MKDVESAGQDALEEPERPSFWRRLRAHRNRWLEAVELVARLGLVIVEIAHVIGL